VVEWSRFETRRPGVLHEIIKRRMKGNRGKPTTGRRRLQMLHHLTMVIVMPQSNESAENTCKKEWRMDIAYSIVTYTGPDLRGPGEPWPRAPTSRGPHQNYIIFVCSIFLKLTDLNRA